MSSKFLNIDSVAFKKSIKASTGDKYLALIAMDVFNETHLGEEGVFARTIRRGGNQSKWPDLKSRYAARKKAKSLRSGKWQRTGSFLQKMSRKTKSLKEDGKEIKFKKSKKNFTLEPYDAIGKAKGDKSKSKKLKRTIFWKNNRKRPFYAWTKLMEARAIRAAERRLEMIIKEVGI
jgi:hypothetical protein